MASPRAKNVNVNYIVKRLEACCDQNGGYCQGCPDLEPCVKAYDARVIHADNHCDVCGKVLGSGRKACLKCGPAGE